MAVEPGQPVSKKAKKTTINRPVLQLTSGSDGIIFTDFKSTYYIHFLANHFAFGKCKSSKYIVHVFVNVIIALWHYWCF